MNYAKQALGKKLSDNIYLTLVDHISFAIQRQEKGIVVRNALLWEIKRFYNHEYLIGKEALAIIKRRLEIELPGNEAGFIALHIVNAQLGNGEMQQTMAMPKMIQSILNIVRYQFHTELDENSVNYERFLTHLKYFLQRMYRVYIVRLWSWEALRVRQHHRRNQRRRRIRLFGYWIP